MATTGLRNERWLISRPDNLAQLSAEGFITLAACRPHRRRVFPMWRMKGWAEYFRRAIFQPAMVFETGLIFPRLACPLRVPGFIG